MNHLVARCTVAILAIAAPLAASAATAADERLVSPALSAFVVGYQAANATQSIREEVPKGETVETWTRMITTQRLGGLVALATPAELAARIQAGVAQRCAGATVSPIREFAVSGHPAAKMQADCPMSDGKPESFVFLAIAGRTDIHVKQAAVRGAGAPTKLDWGDRLLAATVLCMGQSGDAACR